MIGGRTYSRSLADIAHGFLLGLKTDAGSSIARDYKHDVRGLAGDSPVVACVVCNPNCHIEAMISHRVQVAYISYLLWPNSSDGLTWTYHFSNRTFLVERFRLAACIGL